MRYPYDVPYHSDPAIEGFLQSPAEIKGFFEWQKLLPQRSLLEGQLNEILAAPAEKSVCAERLEALLKEHHENAIKTLVAFMENQMSRAGGGGDPLMFMTYPGQTGHLRSALYSPVDPEIAREALKRARFPENAMSPELREKKAAEIRKKLEVLDKKIRDLQPLIYQGKDPQSGAEEDKRWKFVQSWGRTQAAYGQPCDWDGFELASREEFVQAAWRLLGLKKVMGTVGHKTPRRRAVAFG